MNHDVFDTCVTMNDETQMFFDVLIPAGLGIEHATPYALDWLATLHISSGDIKWCTHHFCHNAITNSTIEKVISTQGYAIIKSKGCPGYYR